MDKSCIFRAIVRYGYFMLFLIFLPFCSPSCHSGLSSQYILTGNSTWKLCITKTEQQTLHFKIKGLLQANDKSSGWLAIGFPQPSQKAFPFFHIIYSESFLVQQTETGKKEVNCSLSGKPRRKMVSVACSFAKAMNKYVNSKKIKIFWNTGNSSVNLTKIGQNLIEHHSTLFFYLNQNENQPPENAGSTAMRLLRNYWKSMGAIFGISFLLTALITLTICCCCKKKKPPELRKQKITKDSSVSFYRDESEGDGQSDESDNDENEKVAFIRNNNDRNSSV